MEGKVTARFVNPMKPYIIIKEDQFEALPNEVILHVFSYLKIMDLLKCGQVSQRFRAISNDLWPKSVNLWRRKVGLIVGD